MRNLVETLVEMSPNSGLSPVYPADTLYVLAENTDSTVVKLLDLGRQWQADSVEIIDGNRLDRDLRLRLQPSLIGKKARSLRLKSSTIDNPDARLEINSQGQLVFMSPTGGKKGDRNLEIAFQIKLWNKQIKLEKVFDSSTGFRLSNNAIRSPDVTWIPMAQWNSLTQQQRRKYLPLDPYFVIELMSPTDILGNAKKKERIYKLWC